MPSLVWPLHVELEEGAGQLLQLPGRGRLAGAQPDDRVADPDRLAGPHGEIADDAVALVEQPNHRDPLRHRRDLGGIGGGSALVYGSGGGILIRPILLSVAVAAAGGDRRRQH